MQRIDNPYRLAYGITQITSIGLILGNRAQKDNYNLKTVIAAHAWFDFAYMITAWIVNPKLNPLGFKVAFSF